MNKLNTYIRIDWPGNRWCICEPGQVSDMVDGGIEGRDYTTSEVRMTQAEFDKLPEFEG